ncbi:MAG: flagellar hook-length control protein FliK [Candidatus Scalindua sp.]|nr:flagellar hook-length control protein FliK [Candidatus Scalindua sp.]
MNTLPGIFSPSDSSQMAVVSNKNHKGQTKTGELSFLRVLTDSREGMEGVLNQGLVMGQGQNLIPPADEVQFSSGLYVNRNSLIIDTWQVSAGMEYDRVGKEELLDGIINQVPGSEALSTPINEASLLHLLVSDTRQFLNAEIELGGNAKDLAKRAAETPNSNSVILSSAGVPIGQIQGSGVLPDQNFAGNIGREEPLSLPSVDSTDLNHDTPSPQYTPQRGVEERVSDFDLNGSDVSENQTNEKSIKTQGLDIEQTVKTADTVTNSEKVIQDKKQQSPELFNTRAGKMGESLISEVGAKSNAMEQSVLRSVNTIPSVRGSAGQKENEGGNTLSVSKIGQSLDSASSTDNSSMNTLKQGELATQITEGSSMITETQGDAPREETNQNLPYSKQDLESRIPAPNTSKEISVNPTPESPSSDMTDHIAQRARLFLQGGKSEVRIQLNPPELGNLKLEFTVVDDVIETKISVEKSMIKEIIEKDIPRLRELLSNADVDVGRFDVFLQEKEGARQDFMNKGFLSDTSSKEEENPADGGNDNIHEEGVDDVLEQNTVISSRINYLV